jgi:hypothetical protein
VTGGGEWRERFKTGVARSNCWSRRVQSNARLKHGVIRDSVEKSVRNLDMESVAPFKLPAMDPCYFCEIISSTTDPWNVIDRTALDHHAFERSPV